MRISPVSKVAICTTVRFAASGWIFSPRFATSQQERRCTRAQRAPEGRGPGRPEFHAPSDVGVSTTSVASTNLGLNAGDPWVAPTMSIPQTGAISGLVDARATDRVREAALGANTCFQRQIARPERGTRESRRLLPGRAAFSHRRGIQRPLVGLAGFRSRQVYFFSPEM